MAVEHQLSAKDWGPELKVRDETPWRLLKARRPEEGHRWVPAINKR